jgi:hypothetical protein
MRARCEEPVVLEPLIPPGIIATLSPADLGPDHFDILKQAIWNILTTDVAEFTYAQIIDGLPTTSSFTDFHILRKSSDHPVRSHPALCDGAMDRIRAFRAQFDPISLRFEPDVRYLIPFQRVSYLTYPRIQGPSGFSESDAWNSSLSPPSN